MIVLKSINIHRIRLVVASLTDHIGRICWLELGLRPHVYKGQTCVTSSAF
jgi:hypothetical protein